MNYNLLKKSQDSEIKKMNFRPKNIITLIGEFIIFLFNSFAYFHNLFNRRIELFKQMKRIGYDSIPLIFVTSAFTGLVTAVQASYQTSGYIPTSLIGVLVGKSTMIELAPVLTALVLSGKVGASLSAEIGTMKVTEQLDALKTLAIDPFDFLYLPRIIAGILAFPLLTVFSNFIAIISAFILSHFKYGISRYSFFNNMKNYFLPSDLWGGLVKAVFFGFIVTALGCFLGTKTENGAEGVGKVTTYTVVFSSILILILDFAVASILFGEA